MARMATKTLGLTSTTAIPTHDTEAPSVEILDNIVSLDDSSNSRMKELREKVEAIAAQATPNDHKEADLIRLGIPGQSTVDRKISPVVCALLALKYNSKNRDISMAKLLGFQEDMVAGDWKFHHQGIAFTPNGLLGDGQHRLLAGALSGEGLHTKVSTDFDMDAVDSIDRSTKRTTAQALTMRGVTDAKAKTPVCAAAISYLEAVQHGFKPRLSEQRLERLLLANEALIADALSIGRASTRNITEAVLQPQMAAIWVAIALMSKWDRPSVVGFIAALQQGIATYQDSPTIVLNKMLKKAKDAEKKRDRLSTDEKIALTVKAAGYWSKRQGIARLLWDERREGYPNPAFQPEDTTLPASAAA